MKCFKVGFALGATVLLFGCGKSVQVDQNSQVGVNPPGGNTLRPVVACDASKRVSWRFQQPQPTAKSEVDLLIVADTSASLADKRARVANEISSFVLALPASTDFRVGVIPAHGQSSRYSGKLFAASGSQTVMDSSRQTLDQIKSQLVNTLTHVPADPDDANGEAMMFSLQRSLSPSSLSTIRSQGFYRDNAALTVVFISDENDICYPPQYHGYTTFPDYVPAPTDIELRAYRSNCLNADGSEKITPASTLAALAALKPDGNFSLGGIIHVDASRVPRGEKSPSVMGFLSW